METFGALGHAAAAALGAAVGSFLNVVIHRLPRGESLVHPPSRCPACGHRIRPWHNVPVLGYLVLRGRCRDCGRPISPRYPLVEALVAGLAAGLWARYGLSPAFAAYFVLVAGLVAVTFIDLDYRIIPDALSLGGMAAGFASSFVTGLGWIQSLLGIAAGAGILWAVAWGYEAVTGREGMGFGDVKLLGAIGAFLGWKAVLFTVFVSSVSGAAAGLAWIALKGRDMRFEIPYGPFLALGAVLYVFSGPELVRWYLGVLG